MRSLRVFLIVLATLLTLTQSALLHATALDANLYTSYGINPPHTGIYWVVCGSTQSTDGCYSSGGIGPFGKVGALLEGPPSQNLTKSTVTRLIYVLDIANGSSANGVVLYVYKKVDTISSTYDSVTVTLSKTVALPLTGGSTALASMAANKLFLFVGTDQSPQALRIQKSTLVYSPIGGFSPPVNVTSITSNPYGYVTISFGINGGGGNNGNFIIGPDGNNRSAGGGVWFMPNTTQGVLPQTIP